MVQAPVKQLTFEEYLNYVGEPGLRYELVGGELIAMTPPSWSHFFIAKFLEQQFEAEIQKHLLPWAVLRESGQRTAVDTSRLPDVMVFPLKAVEGALDHAAILNVAALLIVEIVSPSSTGDDYGEKLSEYQAIGVPEYWVVDPVSKRDPRITVHNLDDIGTYQRREYRGDQLILTQTFPSLAVTAQQILRAGQR
jgi:Uma2 family endonuclease